jgi:hypothetical protein
MRTRALFLLLAFTGILPAVTYGQVGNMLRNKMGKVINAGARTANKEIDKQIDSAATKETQKAIDKEKEKALAREDSISHSNASKSAKSDGAQTSGQSSQPSGGFNIGKLMGNKVTLKYSEDYSFNSRIYMVTESYDKKDVTKMDLYMYYSSASPSIGVETKTVSNEEGEAAPLATSMVMDGENKCILMLTDINGSKMGIISPIPDENTAQTQSDGKTVKPSAPTSFTKTGNTKVIAGYKCDEYSYKDTENKTSGKVWFTKDANLKIDKRGWQNTGMAAYYGNTDFNEGIILANEAYDEKGKITMKSETKEINQNFPHSISIKGYTLRQMNLNQGEKK